MIKAARKTAKSATPDISAILTASAEGAMVGVTLHSYLDAISVAESAGLTVEKILVIDRGSEATFAALEECQPPSWRRLELDLGDQGGARNSAVALAGGRWIAFLDGDDLWSFNWLTAAMEIAAADERAIVHPQYNWMFGASNNLFVKVDQTQTEFDPLFLRYGNYWDALCFAPRAAYEQHPFGVRDLRRGYAYEDWHWNCETLDAGWVHRVAPETIHFKRRRAGSQTLNASARSALMRPTPLLSVGWTPPAGPSTPRNKGRTARSRTGPGTPRPT